MEVFYTNKFDVNDFRKDFRIESIIKEFDRYECKFFYDETNNGRKFWLREDGFNSPIDEDFVIGGVMHFGKESNADVEELKRLVNLQKTAKELKSHHIMGNNKFLECMSLKKINKFLSWLEKSDLYIHYSNLNNFYFALTDIVDSVVDDCDIDIYGEEGILLLKSELYKFSKKNFEEVYTLLYKYHYPNIEDADIKKFFENMLQIIDSYNETSFNLEYLKQFLKKAMKKKELIFLKDNPESIILENYLLFYLSPICKFKNAYHTFDNIYEIEEKFREIEIYDGTKKLVNYKFVNSVDNLLIQVSDVVVGLIGKYFTFINRTTIKDIKDLENVLTDFQKLNLYLFAKIIIKSQKKCLIFLHSVGSMNENIKSSSVLEMARVMNLKRIAKDFLNKHIEECSKDKRL